MRLVLAAVLIALAGAPAVAQTPKAPPPRTVQSPAPSAEQCRAACAQRYYFCLAQGEAADCAPAWGQCRRACGKSGAAPR